VLKLKPPPEKAQDLLWDAGYNGNLEVFKTLLKPLRPAQLNNSPRQSCETLERLVTRAPQRNLWTNTVIDERKEECLKCIELLVDAGARWAPDKDEIRYRRRHLLEHDAKYIVRLLRLLIFTAGTADEQSAAEFCDSQTLIKKVATVDPPLAKDLRVLTRQRRTNVADAGAKKETVPAP
jgi:hypothetical protein